MEKSLASEVIEACRDLGRALKILGDILETGATVEGKRAANGAHDEEEKPKRGKKAAASNGGFDEDDGKVPADTPDVDERAEDDGDDFMDKKEEPKKVKHKKVTVDDVNDACRARANVKGGKEGRTEVLKILKSKFKTESVRELKPEQWPQVIQAMEV